MRSKGIEPASSLMSFFHMEEWQRTLMILFLAQLFTATGITIIFPFLPLYVEDLGTNTNISIEFWAGMVFSAQAFTMMITSPIWGALADRYGRKVMVERAMFGGMIMIVLMAFARTAEELVLLRALQGAVTGTVSASNALAASAAPRHRTGFAMATLQVGLWSGVAMGPLIGGPLADAYGFRYPFFITAVLLFISGMMVHFWVKDSISVETKKANRSRGMTEEWRHILAMHGVIQTYIVRFITGLGRSLMTPIMPLFVAALLTGGIIQIQAPGGLDELTPTAARIGTYTGLIIGVASATSTFSAVILGRLGDRIGHRRILIGSALLAAISSLPQAYVTGPWQLFFLQAITGLAYGGLVAAPSALLALYTEPGEEGAVYGLDNSVISGARSLAPLVGAGIAFWFGLRSTFLALTIMYVVVSLLVLALLPRHPLPIGHKSAEAIDPLDEGQLQPTAAD